MIIDKIFLTFFGWIDKLNDKVNDALTFNWGSCEKQDCPKKKKKLNKNNKYFKS